MKTVTWTSTKSLMMQEIRIALKKKSEKGQPPLTRNESNKTWREDILGILSEDQKTERKLSRQKSETRKNKKFENNLE
jgi:hypothetical protein